MASAPPPTLGARHRKGVRWGVFLGDDSGNRPTLADRKDWLIVRRCTTFSGGPSGHAQTIELEVNLKKAGFRLQDLAVPIGYNRLVEVRQRDENNLWSRVIAWGQLTTQRQRLGEREESMAATARLDWNLAGERLMAYTVWDPIGAAVISVHREIVFNPMVDGKIEGNRSDRQDDDDAFLLLDPESMRTPAARTLQGNERLKWDLPKAVHRLCWTLNPAEAHFTNPTMTELDLAFAADVKLVRKVRIPLGANLFEALDLLLHPLGYDWYPETTVDDTDPSLPVLGTFFRFYKQGVGIPLSLKAQRVQSPLDPVSFFDTNVADYSATIEIARPNVIIGLGSLQQVEGTLPLIPAWDYRDDSVSLSVINQRDETGRRKQLHLTKSEQRLIGRKWVLNEAGDYKSGVRRPIEVTSATDLAELFGTATVPRRRKLLPCLTRNESDQAQRGHGGVYLEWHDGTQWRAYTGSFDVLENECGVYLSGDIAEDFWSSFQARYASLPPDPFLRVTATIEGDERLEHRTSRRDVAPMGRDITMTLDLGDRFHDRVVKRDGDFASRWYSDQHFLIGLVSGSTIVVAGDCHESVVAAGEIVILDLAGASGRYKVTAASYSSPNTTITLSETLPTVAVVSPARIGVNTEEEDDSDRIQFFSEEARDNGDGASVACSAILKGHTHHEYQIGKLIDDVATRNVSLNAYAPAATTRRLPQIVAITHSATSASQQRTELVLEQMAVARSQYWL